MTTDRFSLALLTLHLLGALAVGSSAQTVPLPEALESRFAPFGSNYSGLYLRPSSDPADALRLNAVAPFATKEKTVSFFWSFCPPGGPPGMKTVEYDLSYEPTALCRKNGYGPSFYIAGYLERQGKVIIEEWTFENIATSVAASPQGGHPVPSLTMTVNKEIIAITDTLQPLFGMAYHTTADDIWLFEETTPRAVFKIDLDTVSRTIAYQFDAQTSGWSALEASGRITTSWIETSAPDGGGFVSLALGARNWERLPPAEQCSAFMMRDVGFDGSFDDVIEGTTLTLVDARGYRDHGRQLYP